MCAVKSVYSFFSLSAGRDNTRNSVEMYTLTYLVWGAIYAHFIPIVGVGKRGEY